MGGMYRGDDIGVAIDPSSDVEALGQSEYKAYVSNLTFRRDLAKSNLDRRMRELDMINLGVHSGRNVSQDDIFEEMRGIEQDIKSLNHRLSIARNALASFDDE